MCMKYTKLLYMMFLTILSIQIKSSHHIQQQHLNKVVEDWLYKHFASKLYKDLSYTENLFMGLKQHLLEKRYTTQMSHQGLKSIVKDNIIALKHKKYHTRYWFQKHKKQLTLVIQEYFKNHNNNDPWGVYRYLNTSKESICLNLQQTMKMPNILPAYLNELIKSLIKNNKGK